MQKKTNTAEKSISLYKKYREENLKLMSGSLKLMYAVSPANTVCLPA